MIVSNATALIFLSKINKIHLLKDLFSIVIIPKEVAREVVDEGKKGNHMDAFEVEKAIKDGWIKVQTVEIEPLIEGIGIDKGEAEAISLAYKKKLKILVDQTHAREAAQLLSMKPRGTLYVLFLALKKGLITYDDYLGSLLDLVRAGFRMSEEVYLDAIKLGKNAGNK